MTGSHGGRGRTARRGGGIASRAGRPRPNGDVATGGSLVSVALHLVIVATSACKPNLADTVSIITAPEVLAVRSDPAEAAPMAAIQYRALYVGPAGSIESQALDWAFCNARKPLAELEPVNPQCLERDGSWFQDLGRGQPVTAAIPAMACQQFGPNVPLPQAGQPPGRPVDPDPTGGYYQPVRVLAPAAVGDVSAVDESRLSCGLAAGAADVVAAFAHRYHPNNNPAVLSFGPPGASWVTDDAGTNQVVSGERIALEVAWPSYPVSDCCGDGVCGPEETAVPCANCGASVSTCPGDCSGATVGASPPGVCVPDAAAQGGAERFVTFDPASNALTDQREGMSVAWYATAGAFDVDRTGRSGSDRQSTSDNVWTSPGSVQTVWMWIVLRDSRGGVAWSEYRIQVGSP